MATWIDDAFEAVALGDEGRLIELLREHPSSEEHFRLMKASQWAHGMTTQEMCEAIEDFTQRWLAKQPRH